MSTATARFDVADHLVDETTMAHYLTDCLEEGGVALFLHAIGDVARASGMSSIASGAGVTRASLYKAFGEGGNPALGTVVRVLDALGFRLEVAAKPPARKATRKQAKPAAARATVKPRTRAAATSKAPRGAAMPVRPRKPGARKRPSA